MPLLLFVTQKGISLVVDNVLQKGVSELQVIDRLRSHACIVNVHTIAHDPSGRYEARIKTSTLPSIVQRRELLLGRVEHHRQDLDRTATPLDLVVPQVAVRTDGGLCACA